MFKNALKDRFVGEISRAQSQGCANTPPRKWASSARNGSRLATDPHIGGRGARMQPRRPQLAPASCGPLSTRAYVMSPPSTPSTPIDRHALVYPSTPHLLTPIHQPTPTPNQHINASITLRSSDELAVAWAKPPDLLLRDHNDASAYKLEIREADYH